MKRFVIYVIDTATNTGGPSEMAAIDAFNDHLQSNSHWITAAGIGAPIIILPAGFISSSTGCLPSLSSGLGVFALAPPPSSLVGNTFLLFFCAKDGCSKLNSMARRKPIRPNVLIPRLLSMA